jgi:putative CocE/NonD family hydrolase
MKYLLLTIVFLLLLTASPTRLRAQQMTPALQELTDYIKDNYTKREVMIPMRDGVKLFTSIYEPKNTSEKYPILLQRTPYTVAPYGADKFPFSLGPSMLYASEGYIFVYQDVRGRWMSEGEFVDVRPDIANTKPTEIDESTDTYDTVDWLIKNVRNNNGRVGMYGISYPGFYTSAGIIDTHPAIKAASPQAPVGDWFVGDDWHHNGAFFLASAFQFYGEYGQPRPVPVTPETATNKLPSYGTRDGYKYFLEMGSLANSDDRFRQQIGTDIKFWNQMMEHPNYDEFWQARNILPKLKNIKCAVMTVGGWFDAEDLHGALRTYEAIERQNPGIFNVLVMGPWNHGGWAYSSGKSLGNVDFLTSSAEFYRAQLELPFFNYFLKDKGDIKSIRELNVFETGTNEWKFYDKTRDGSWSPREVEQRTIYLQPDGKLDFLPPPATASRAASAYDEYVSDPAHPVPFIEDISVSMLATYMTSDQRHNSRRADVLVYQTEPLAADMTVAGDFNPTLFASTSGTDSDFIVKVIDVFPDNLPANPDTRRIMGGYQMLVRGEPFRARFRNSFSKPEAMRPNAVEKIEFVMPGITHTFKKGHRLMVQIQSTWFPLVDRNPQTFVPNIFEAKETDFQKATQRIYRSGPNASRIAIRVLKHT